MELVLAAKGVSAKNRGGDVELHPAARTFQTLRILVNDEIANLNRFLLSAPYALKPGGRMGVLTFHSVEDRLVKHAFRDGLRGGVFDEVSDEPIRPSAEEIRNNPRSSPAKFSLGAADLHGTVSKNKDGSCGKYAATTCPRSS